MSARPIVGSYSGYPTMVEEAGAGTIVPAGDAAALEAEILRYRALSGEELAMYEGTAAKVLTPDCRAWLEQGRSAFPLGGVASG